VTGRLLKPIRLVTDTAREISETDLARRIPIDQTNDEIIALARTFNDMLDRLEEAFDTQRRFVDDAGHELRTPARRPRRPRRRADLPRVHAARGDPAPHRAAAVSGAAAQPRLGYDYDPGSNLVDVYVGYLRRKLGGHRIRTVRGMSYRLEPDTDSR
jgi:HAMP domain-containing protein